MANEQADIRNNICPICRLPNTILPRQPTTTRTFELHCARCGDYDITIEAVSKLNHTIVTEPNARPLIAGWIWEQNSVGVVPRLTRESLPALLARTQLPFFERAKRLLIYL